MVFSGKASRKCLTAAAIELTWPGVPVTACASILPSRSNTPAERSPASRTVVLNAVRTSVCACSSTTAISRLHMICIWIWDKAVFGREIIGRLSKLSRTRELGATLWLKPHGCNAGAKIRHNAYLPDLATSRGGRRSAGSLPVSTRHDLGVGARSRGAGLRICRTHLDGRGHSDILPSVGTRIALLPAER